MLSGTVRGVRSLASALLLTVVAAAGCAHEREADTLRLPPDGRWFGFSSNTFEHTGRDRGPLDLGVTAERSVADARAAGANSARVQVAWWDLERSRGHVDRAYVALIRRFVSRFERRGGRVVLVLGVPPPWASAKPGDPRAAPAARAVASYAAYAGSVARLFPTALAIETWNEPNTSAFWVPGAPDPALYARMQKRAAAAIHAASPKVRVLLGGLVAAPDDSPGIVSPRTYVARMRQAGLSGADYDGVAAHVYPGERDGQMAPLDGAFGAAMDNLRAAAGEGSRLWITETGVTSSGPGNVSPREQARGLVEVVGELLAMDDVAGVWVHTLYDATGAPSSDPERGYGVIRAHGARPGTPKAAFCALRAHTGGSLSARCRSAWPMTTS